MLRRSLMFDVAGATRDVRLRILVAVICSWTTLPVFAQAPPPAGSATAPRVTWSAVPLSFEPNVGQEPPEVHYLARGSSYTLYLADSEILLSGQNQPPLTMTFVGANPAPRIFAEDRQASASNYLVGSPSKWRTSVPNYGRARYQGAYPGIDLVYYGHDGNLEYDWIVSPSADPRTIRLGFADADRVRIDKQGDLVVTLGQTEYRHKKPVVYQEVGGQRIAVAGAWRVRGKEAGFRIGRYDRTRSLTIDPVLFYSTYLGGAANDYAYAVAVDRFGNTYVTGGTASANFPTRNPLQGSLRGSNDVFVTKLNPGGSAKIYSTYLGSTGVDEGKGIAVDSHGAVYVTGSAGFSDFPMKNAIQPTWGGSGDAFLAKLDPTGSSLVYSTYLGGNAVDYGTAVALDPAGNAYITGVTFSANLPTVNPFQSAKGLQQDAFVAKINAAGSAWQYVTYLGGNSVDEAYGLAVDASGNAYLTGWTQSTNFPTQSPFQGSNHGGVDGFVTKLNPAGSALVYSTYLGGTGNDNGTAIAVDASGNAYVTGVTASEDFPLANPIDNTLGSHAVDDVFISKFNPAGSALVYSTFVGGGSEDDAYAIAIDKAGNAYVTGRTNSSDFPLVNAIQVTRFAFDMFVTEINAAGSALTFSTFVGGSGSESGRGIAIDAIGNIHVAGETTSADFPVLKAIQGANGGVQDAVVLQFGTRVQSGFADFAGSGFGGQVLYSPSNGQEYTELSNGDGTFSSVPNQLTAGFDIVRAGDFNGDGKADLVVYNSQTALAYIGLGNGAGGFTFQSLFWSPGYDFVETGDINSDGATDFVLYNSQTGTMYAAISNGDGTFTYKFTAISTGFTYVRLADFSGDGKADLFLYRMSDGLSFLGIGDGTGTFAFNAVPFAAGYDYEDVGDLNGDGKADLILYNDLTGAMVTAISNGAGGFAVTASGTLSGFTSVRLADFTGDGNADLVLLSKNSGDVYVGIGTGSGAFVFQYLLRTFGFDYLIPEDLNGDGRADLIFYVSQYGSGYSAISKGDGTFTYGFLSWGAGLVPVDQNHPAPSPYSAPAITLDPLSHTVNPGSLVTFRAAASGNPVPQVQWQVSSDYTNWSDLSGANSTVYAFVPQASDSNKIYRARFSNPIGSVTTSALLVRVRATAVAAKVADFDGSGSSDFAVWRPSNGTFYSTSGAAVQWGVASVGDKPLSGDFDGDGIADFAVWRPTDGTFYWLTSTSGFDPAHAGLRTLGSGSTGDIPMLADLDGDLKADLVVWRPSNGTFYWMPSSTNYTTVRSVTLGSGSTGDKPMLGDFDGDGKADLIVWRPGNGTWYWLTSSSNYTTGFSVPFGSGSVGDIPLIGDIDGDGKSEITIWRPGNGTFYWLKSSAGYTVMGSQALGTGTLQDVPMLLDVDGDGHADLIVWRPGTGIWYVYPASGIQWGYTFGGLGDIPIR